jgi:hypothetical protein
MKFVNMIRCRLIKPERLNLTTLNYDHLLAGKYLIKNSTSMKSKVLFVSIMLFVLMVQSNCQIFFEDFENSGVIPSGWTNELDNNRDWEFTDSLRVDNYSINSDRTTGSGYFAVFYFDDYLVNTYWNGRLTSPTIDLSSTTNPTLRFYMNRPKYYSINERLRVNIYANGSWNYNVIPDLNMKTIGWKKISLNLSEYKYNDVIIQFHVYCNYYCLIGLDDVLIYEDYYDCDSKFLEPQDGQIEGDTINHINYLNNENYLEVFNMGIADTDTLDNIPTIITKTTFKRIAGADMDLSRRIIDADIFKDGIRVNKSGLIADSYNLILQFDEGEFIIEDTSQITLKIAFDTAMWDYSSFGFLVDSINHGWETADSSSHFPYTISNGLIKGNKFVIDIEATRLQFNPENPKGAFVNDTLTQYPVVEAADIYGNRDYDYNDEITLVNSLNIPMIGNAKTMFSGEVAFPYFAFTEKGVETILSTSNTQSLINGVNSTPITIFDQIIFEDDFESGEGWTISGEFQIGRPSNMMGGGVAWNAFSGIKALTLDSIGSYENDVALYDEVAISPAIDLSGNYKKLGIWFKSYSVFYYFDKGTIDYSADGGNNWSSVDTAFVKWQGWWMNEIYVLDESVISDQLLIRFSYESDTADGADGWNIDDFKIIAIMDELSAENSILATSIGILNANSINDIPASTIISTFLSGLTISEGATVVMLESSGGDEVENPGSTSISENMVALVTAENGSTKEYSLNLINTLNTADVSGMKDIVIYPIPAHDVIFIEAISSKDNNSGFELFDINGKLILSEISYEGNKVKIDMSAVSAGIYYLTVHCDNKTKTYKIPKL